MCLSNVPFNFFFFSNGLKPVCRYRSVPKDASATLTLTRTLPSTRRWRRCAPRARTRRTAGTTPTSPSAGASSNVCSHNTRLRLLAQHVSTHVKKTRAYVCSHNTCLRMFTQHASTHVRTTRVYACSHNTRLFTQRVFDLLDLKEAALERGEDVFSFLMVVNGI